MSIPFGVQQIEFDQYISPDGEVYRFSNAQDQFLISGIGGMGMPELEYRTQRGPFQHGSTPLGVILEPRLIQLLHRGQGRDRTQYWDKRSELLDAIRPNRQVVGQFNPGTLRKILPDRSKRDICVFINDGPSFQGSQQGRWDEWAYQEALQFIAHDPTVFDPDMNSQNLTLDSFAQDIEFPFTFPVTFLSNSLAVSDNITYTGTWLSYPTIFLTGPMRNPIFRNNTTGEKIEFNLTLAANRVVTVSLQYGNKTVEDDLGNNLIGTITTDSDLASFHLEPAPGAPLGVNGFGVSASEITSASKMSLQWFTRYIGI